MIPCIPFVFGVWISLTRIVDFSHSTAAVIVGITIGMGVAYFSFWIFSYEWFGNQTLRVSKTPQISTQNNVFQLNTSDNTDAYNLRFK